MKNKFLIVTKLFFVLVTLSFFTISCENDDFVPEFTLQEASEQVSFLNSFSSEYLLSSETKNNIAERFVWNQPEFDVPTAVSFSLEGSTTDTFDTIVYESGTLSDNNHAVTVGSLLTIAQDYLNLDDDPTTEDIGNTGTVYFRVKAFPGTGSGQDAILTTSETSAINITIIEKELNVGGVQVSSWGVVGSGYNNWGAFVDAPFYTTSSSDVYVAYVTLLDGEIKFRENNAWDNNYGDTGADGTLDAGGDNIVVSAGTYKITLDLGNNTYSMEEYSWGVVGSGYNDWGGAGPDAKFFYDYTTDTFKVNVKLITGEIKFRLNNGWDVNYGDTGADGTLDAGGDNLVVTEGFYTITLDLNNLTYTMQETDVWGIVGSGYNDWGATPDFTMTEVNPGIWVADGVTLIDGEIKFRVNEGWDTNYGDSGADGTLDAGGDNIVVTSGLYVITMDLNELTYSLGKQN